MITSDMTVAEVISRFPSTIELFRRYGLECPECRLSELENLLRATTIHHVDTERFLAELNQLIESAGTVR